MTEADSWARKWHSFHGPAMAHLDDSSTVYGVARCVDPLGPTMEIYDGQTRHVMHPRYVMPLDAKWAETLLQEVMPFCACGRRLDSCDGSRKGCRRE